MEGGVAIGPPVPTTMEPTVPVGPTLPSMFLGGMFPGTLAPGEEWEVD